MTKTHLIDRLADKLDQSKTKTAEMVNALLDLIGEELEVGGKVSIAGFGVFEARDRAARMAKNPSTGEDIHISAKRAPVFKAGSALKARLNQ